MSLKDIWLFAGGIALFLYGMYEMGEGLKGMAGERLWRCLRHAAKTPLRAAGAGAVVTALLQSSSAVTVMAVQFVNAGFMELEQAAGVIIGANVGTCVTAWLTGLPAAGDGLFAAALFGAALLVFWGSLSGQNRGTESENGICALWGLSLLFLGMKGMQTGTAGLARMPGLTHYILHVSGPLQGVLAGSVITGVLQSSSLSVGILQALCAGGAVRYETAIPVVFGQNIGTCVTALLACIGVRRKGRAVAMLHLLFNVCGTAFCMIGLYEMDRMVGFSFWEKSVSGVGIAVIHTAFNLVTAGLMLPGVFVWSRMRRTESTGPKARSRKHGAESAGPKAREWRKKGLNRGKRFSRIC